VIKDAPAAKPQEENPNITIREILKRLPEEENK
jgi:hypothetical protein